MMITGTSERLLVSRSSSSPSSWSSRRSRTMRSGSPTAQWRISSCRPDAEKTTHVMVFEVIDDHASHRVVVFDNKDARGVRYFTVRKIQIAHIYAPRRRNPSTRNFSSPKVRRVSGREGLPARSKRFCAAPALIGRRLRSNRCFRCGALISLGDTHRGPERHRERRRDAKRCGLRHQKHLRVPIARRAITKDLVLSSRPRSVRLTMAFCRLLHDPPSLAGEERQPVPRLAAGL